ncbi:hypothetical protein ASfcp2_193 [Aeromonas phage AsFcp_2]|nr:hypothetical protein ASfcp2_193 [Aeromonas phage AsFcp_2]
MAVMKIGVNYEFKNDNAKENYRTSHDINRRVTKAIEAIGGVFQIVSGDLNGDFVNTKGEVVDDVMTYLADRNGKVIHTDNGKTLINEHEMQYFQVEAEKPELDPNVRFTKTPFDKLMAIYKSYHPDAPDSKITVVGIRKAWDMHNQNIRELEEKIEILTKTLAQRKEML